MTAFLDLPNRITGDAWTAADLNHILQNMRHMFAVQAIGTGDYTANNYEIAATNESVFYDFTTGNTNRTVGLPSATLTPPSTYPKPYIIVKKVDSGTGTLDVDGLVTLTLINQFVWLRPRGGSWEVFFSSEDFGSGGTGLTNYISNGDAEDGTTTNWTAYNDQASTSVSTSFANSGDLVTRSSHGFSVGQAVVFISGTLGAGLSLNTKYYILTVPSSSTFTLSLTRGGSTVEITADQGANTVVMHVIDYVNGTGGSTNGDLAISNTDTDPIFGSKSFLIAKAAAAQQAGKGFSVDFSINNSDRGKVLQARILATLFDGDLIAEGDFEVYIYDVTNSQIIQPVPFKLAGMVEGNTNQYEFLSEFQANYNSLSYRFSVHCMSASTSAVSLKLDEISVSPSIKSVGFPATDWESYTPSFTGLGTVANIVAKWRRVGDSMEVMGKGTSGTCTAALGSVSIPSGKTIETTKSPYTNTTANDGNAVGWWTQQSGANNGRTAKALTHTGTSTSLVYMGGAVTGTNHLVAQNGNTWMDDSSNFYFHFIVPIAGWSGQTIMSEGSGQQDIHLDLIGTPGSSVSPNNPIIMPTIQVQKGISYNSVTGRWTILVSGRYLITMYFNTNAADGTLGYMTIDGDVSGGTINYPLGIVQSANGQFTGSVVADLIAGQVIDVRSNGSISATSPANRLTVTRLGDSQRIAASEKVLAMVYRAATQSIPDATNTVALFDTKLKDSHGMYDVATGKFVCTMAGDHRLSGSIAFESNASGERIIVVQKNGSSSGVNLIYCVEMQAPSTGAFAATYLAPLPDCIVGDYFQVIVYQNRGGSLNIGVTSNLDTFACFEKL